MDTAWLWAERSTCSRLHVGCVVARDSRILVTGYNGAPAGMPHCVHKGNEPCTISVHAEANAIAFAARYGLSLEGADLYTTHMPCLNCSMLIVNAGIAAVVWEVDYRDPAGLQMLKGGNVGFGRFTRPGPGDDMMDT